MAGVLLFLGDYGSGYCTGSDNATILTNNKIQNFWNRSGSGFGGSGSAKLICVDAQDIRPDTGICLPAGG